MRYFLPLFLLLFFTAVHSLSAADLSAPFSDPWEAAPADDSLDLSTGETPSLDIPGFSPTDGATGDSRPDIGTASSTGQQRQNSSSGGRSIISSPADPSNLGGEAPPSFEQSAEQPVQPRRQPQPVSPQQPSQPPQQLPQQPPQGMMESVPINETSVHLSMRSQLDPDHPFYQLQLSRDPIDPNSKIVGKSLTICEMLESVSSPQTRCQLLHAYWALTREIARYKIALSKQVQLSKWGQQLNPNDPRASMLQAAEKLASAQRQTLELCVILKQTELASMLKQTGYYKPIAQANQVGGDPLPVPCDLPFIKTYTTNVNRLVSFRPASNLMLLDKTIAMRKKIFESKNQEFVASEELFQKLQDSVFNAQGPMESLIQANDRYFATFAEFTDAIITYNDDIAEYVALSVGPEITGRRLLMTLIQLNPEHPEPSGDPADSVPVME